MMRTRHWLTIVAGAFFCLPFASLQADFDYTDSHEAEFVEGGRITIELSAGEHRIAQSPDQHIRLYWRAKDREKSRNAHARTDVDGSKAKIRLDGPRKNFESLILVPRGSDISVHLTAGELTVGNVEGDRDINLRAGDLSIEVGDTEDYAHVEGSLWAGDIDGGPFGTTASGLFRSIEWQGEGEREVRFKLYAGDVRLYAGKQQD